MNNFNLNDERFYPLLLPLLVGGAVGFPLGYAASNKNNQPCCNNNQMIPYNYYQPYPYYPQSVMNMPYYPYVEYNNYSFPNFPR